MLSRIAFAMPQRIIPSCIVGGVKPYQLIEALMAAEELGPLPLAKKLKKPELQPLIHRFINGAVKSPKSSTAIPLADYFNLPLEAIYQEKVATEIAKQRGLKALPPKPPKKPKRPSSGGVADFASKFMAMPPELQREALAAIGIEVNTAQPSDGENTGNGESSQSQTDVPAETATNRSRGSGGLKGSTTWKDQHSRQPKSVRKVDENTAPEKTSKRGRREQ